MPTAVATSTDRGLLSVTRRARALVCSPHAPQGSRWYYGMAVPFQVAPRLAGMMVNIRDVGERGGDHVDFEVGTDLVLFDDVQHIDSAGAIPVSRNHEEINPHAAETGIMVKHPLILGFVPHGSLRADGSRHPHAGTGFALCQAVCWPLNPRNRLPDGSLRPFGAEQSHTYIEVCQLEFDGRQMHLTQPSRAPAGNEWLRGFKLGFVGLTPAVPDGDDLLMPMHGCRIAQDRHQIGLARWSRIEGRWRPVAWHQVASLDDEHGEMSLVRDVDGSLLYSARANTALTCHNMHVWRSTDGGRTWRDQVKVQWIRSAAPVTINQAADGTPYMLANLYETPLVGTRDRLKVPMTPAGWQVVGGYRRDKLYAWPLSDDRLHLEPPVLVRDCDVDFGPPPGGSTWSADHPMALTLRLADGCWRNVLVYRVLERGENGMHCPPTGHTGCYVEEAVSKGTPRGPWRFTVD